MRILKVADVLGPAFGVGGMNDFMIRSADSLRREGHDVTLMFTEDIAPHVRTPGLRRLFVPWVVLWKVWRQSRSGPRHDVVEIHEQIAAAYCFARRMGARRLLPPCVAISYGAREDFWRAQRQRWAVCGTRGRRKSRLAVPLTLLPQSRYALRHADHLLVPSDHEHRYVREELAVPPDRLTRIDPGVGSAYFELPRRTPDAHGLRLLFVGNWIDRKGIPELTAAWSVLSEREPSAQLTVSCTVRSEAEVLSAFERHADRVTVQPTASEDELIATLARNDVFVLPAWFEGGMPLAALQAAAAGLACVVTDIGGHVELFRSEDPMADGGILVPPHDADALADALLRLAADPALIRELGERARARARAFTWDATAGTCLAAYEHALLAA